MVYEQILGSITHIHLFHFKLYISYYIKLYIIKSRASTLKGVLTIVRNKYKTRTMNVINDLVGIHRTANS